MMKFCSILIVSIVMFIIPVLNLKDQPEVDPLKQTSFTSLLFDHEFEMTQIASLLELQASKLLLAYRGYDQNAIQLVLHNQLVLNVIEFFSHDKPFFIVKKFQSNYLI